MYIGVPYGFYLVNERYALEHLIINRTMFSNHKMVGGALKDEIPLGVEDLFLSVSPAEALTWHK